MPKNKGFNKQGLEKAGINMQHSNGQIILSADQRAAMERQQAAQQIQSLINFRSTCAMNNLGALLGVTKVGEPEYHRFDTLAPLACVAKQAAEVLMVELKMIPSTQFFRDLEAQADKEQAASTNNIVTE